MCLYSVCKKLNFELSSMINNASNYRKNAWSNWHIKIIYDAIINFLCAQDLSFLRIINLKHSFNSVKLLQHVISKFETVAFLQSKRKYLHTSVTEIVYVVQECVSTVMLCVVIVYILPGKFIL